MRARWPYLFSFAFCTTMAALASLWWLASAAAMAALGGLRAWLAARRRKAGHPVEPLARHTSAGSVPGGDDQR